MEKQISINLCEMPGCMNNRQCSDEGWWAVVDKEARGPYCSEEHARHDTARRLPGRLCRAAYSYGKRGGPP